MSPPLQNGAKQRSHFHESMKDDHRVPVTRTNVELSTQKVKDTCDMCSASKVRCNKIKPICSRCERLGYPCFYSPARRVRKRPSSRDEPEAVEQLVEPQTPAISRSESPATESDVSDEITNAALGKEHCVATPFNAGDPCSSPFSRRQDIICLQANFDDEKFQPSAQELTPSSSACFHRSNLSSDCVASATVLLQNLHETSNKIFSLADPTGELKASSLDGAIDVASASVKHIPTMLICPCSARPDNGFLVAAVCSALLDLYEVLTFLCHSVRSTNAVASTIGNGGSHGSGKRTSHLSSDSEMIDICTENLLNQLNEKAPIMRILGELHAVADVVTQFRNRYSQISEKGSRDLLRALAASIASRLKSMIDESTNESTKI